MFMEENLDRKKKEKKREICQKCQNSINSVRNYMQQGNTTQVFRELMCSILGLSNGENGFSIRKYWNTFWTSYWHKSKQANELIHHSKRLKISQSHYETFWNKSSENNTDAISKSLQNRECFVKALVIFKIYNSCLTNANFQTQETKYSAFRRNESLPYQRIWNSSVIIWTYL